jgi:hypothetical protein
MAKPRRSPGTCMAARTPLATLMPSQVLSRPTGSRARLTSGGTRWGTTSWRPKGAPHSQLMPARNCARPGFGHLRQELIIPVSDTRQARPQVRGGGEPGHVDPDLGQDDRGGDRTDARDVIEAGRRRRERGQPQSVRWPIVLRDTQARAELPGGSCRTVAVCRIEPHRAGAVALQAVEHADRDGVVGGPVRGCAAGYPHGRLRIVGELPIAGAFVADPCRFDCLWCGCHSHVDCSGWLLGRQITRGCHAAGPRESRAGPGRRWCVPRSAWSG